MLSTGERFIPGQTGVIEIEHLNRYYFVVNQIDLRGKIVLDIASGEGYGSNILSNYAKEVIGVDKSDEAINHAKITYKKENLIFLQGDASLIPIADNKFDVVVSFETLEHHEKHKEMMLEIKRVLKEDGIVIISTPNKYYYSDLPKYSNEYHVKELYFEEFKNLMNTFFKIAIFYSQSTVIGSLIFLYEETKIYKKTIVFDNDGLKTKLNPIYNIAVCSNNKKLMLENQMILYNYDEILTPSDLEIALNKGKEEGMRIIRKTKAYRLGKYILKPIIKIRNKIT